MTQLGLFHNNMFNQFNLASDLMEPFRILIDRKVVDMILNVFELQEKMEIVDLLNMSVIIDNTRSTVINAIKLYTRSVFEALNDHDVSLIRFYRYEL